MMNDQASTLRKKFSNAIQDEKSAENPLVRSLSISSGKGGVGKTNIVVNLAIQLAKMDKRVFLIDADLGLANIDIMLNLAPEYTIEDVLAGTKNINDIIIEGPFGIHILPASSGISEMQSLSAEQQMSMLTELSSLKTRYDYILIDTGAGISSNVLRFNAAVDEICVVTNTEPTSITDAYALMKIMSSKYQVGSFNLIVNESSLQEAKSVYTRLVKVLNKFLTVNLELIGFIPRDLNFVRAIRQQTPLSILSPNSPTTKAFSNLARQIEQNPGQSIEDEDKETFWQRLSNWKRTN
jgi:flagellar biosynthesis protein FlhG